jgi:hypothetical protein
MTAEAAVDPGFHLVAEPGSFHSCQCSRSRVTSRAATSAALWSVSRVCRSASRRSCPEAAESEDCQDDTRQQNAQDEQGD